MVRGCEESGLLFGGRCASSRGRAVEDERDEQVEFWLGRMRIRSRD